MGTLLPEIQPEALRELIDKSNLKHSDIARQLGVSRKTIQRWLNGNVSRTNLSQIEKLADLLGCTPEAITNSEKAIIVAPKNRILEAVLSADIIHCIQSAEQWQSLYNILKQFEGTPLPTDQEAHLLSYLGYVQFQLGRYRSSWKYLHESLAKSRAADLKNQQIKTLCHLSALNRIRGQLEEARENLRQARDLVTSTTPQNLRADLKFREAKLFIASNDLSSAEKYLRQSIVLELRSPQKPKTGLGIKYIYMARLTLRKKKPFQALRFYKRASIHAHRDFQRHSEGVSQYGMALCHLFISDTTAAEKHLRLARNLVGGEKQIRSSHKLLQIEFIFALLSKDFTRARLLLTQRFQKNRQSKLLVLETLKLAFILDHASEHTFPIRRTWAELYRRYSRTSHVPSIEAQLQKMDEQKKFSDRSPLDLMELMELVVL